MYAINTTVAGMRAISSPDLNTIYQTTDYGGGQWYFDPSGSGSDDTGTILEPSGGGGIFKRIMSENTVNLDWFISGAVTADKTSVFQYVLDNFSTINIYKSITISSVTITKPLIINCFNSATIYSTNNDYVLYINGTSSSTRLENIKINNLIIDCRTTGVTTSSITSGINIAHVDSLRLVNYRVYGAASALYAVDLQLSNIETIYGLDLGNGIYFQNCVDVTISGRLHGPSGIFSKGIHIDSLCDGIKTAEFNSIHANIGYHVTNSLNGSENQPKSLILINSDLGDGNYGVYIEAGLHIAMSALNVVTCAYQGVYIKNAGPVTFGNSEVTNNQMDGIYLDNSKDITISGVDVFLNSLSASNTYDGISIHGNSDNIIIMGGTIGAPDFALLNQNEKQRYGVYNNSNGTKIAVLSPRWETNLGGNYFDISKLMLVIDNSGIYNPSTAVIGSQGSNSLTTDTLQVFGTSRLWSNTMGIALLIDSNQPGSLVQRIRNLSSNPSAYGELQVSEDTGVTAGLTIRSSGYSKPSFATLYSNSRLELDSIGGVSVQVTSISGAPTTANLSAGQAGLFIDNTTSQYAIYANLGGNIINVSGGKVDVAGTLIPNNVGGTYTASGTGSVTIVIPHGLLGINSLSTPLVNARNIPSSGISYVNVDSTNVYINYSTAPPTGTNNLQYSIIIKK